MWDAGGFAGRREERPRSGAARKDTGSCEARPPLSAEGVAFPVIVCYLYIWSSHSSPTALRLVAATGKADLRSQVRLPCGPRTSKTSFRTRRKLLDLEESISARELTRGPGAPPRRRRP